jgi:hypothetical protein
MPGWCGNGPSSWTSTGSACDRRPLQRQSMTTFTQLAAAPSDPPEPFTNRLRLAVAAYLARFKGTSREHTESDLRSYLAWCAERGLDPLVARRPHLELYHPVDAGSPPAQAFHRLPEILRHSRVLPDLRPRRHPGALTRRARPPPFRPHRITHSGVHPPAIRGPAHRRPPVAELV